MTRPHISAAPYRLAHGSTLSPAEAAHLLTRAAQGEHLTHAPVKADHGYHLAHVATLTEQQRQQHRAQVAQLARLLITFTAPSLSA
ncbi:hypothetical protein [Deinococcus altitudinis]|uniref:hypothetical protein n=1 Tax=Deinococcus altitudinis TaxID=468914 RepID=UPI003891CD35